MSEEKRIVASYDYRDESGNLQYQVVRYAPKDFRQRRPEGKGWMWTTLGVRRMLYRLPEVIKGSADRTVWIVEGEKDANNLAELGLVATTIAGGAKAAWTPAILEPLRFRDVVFIPDNDDPGREFMMAGARALRGLSTNVSFIELPGLPPKGDFSDWIEMPGNNLSKLIHLPRKRLNLPDSEGAKAAEPETRNATNSGEFGSGPSRNTPNSGTNESPCIPLFDIHRDLLKLENIEARQIEWLWRHWLPKGKLALLDGDPGLGKSFVTLDLAARLSRGENFPDGGVGLGKPAATLIVACEDSIEDTMLPRLKLMNADLRMIRTWQGERRDGRLFRLPRIPDDLAALEAMIVACDAKLVIIDPLMAFLSESVNTISDQSVRGVLTPMAVMAEKLGATILFVRHLNKTNGKNAVYRGGGSIGIIAAMRTTMLIGRHPNDRDLRVLAMVKTNIGPEPKSQGFKLQVAKFDPEGREVCWIGPIELFANDLVGDVKENLNPKEWLKMALMEGPRLATELYEEAQTEGIPHRTLERAKASLGIVAKKRRLDKKSEPVWWWLPVGQTSFPDDYSGLTPLPSLDDDL